MFEEGNQPGHAPDPSFNPTSNPTSDPIPSLLCDPFFDSQHLQVEGSTALYEADTAARHLYFIESGQVRIILPGKPGKNTSARLLEILGPGDWFGVPALAGSATYQTLAVAVKRTAVWRLPVDRLMEHLQRVPSVASELIRQLAGKVEAAHAGAADLVFEDTYQRLVKTLLQFSRTAAATQDEDGRVVLQMTHQQLAQAIGAARETVSLTLTQLRQKNVVRTGRNRLWFDPVVLEEFASGGPAGATASSGERSRRHRAGRPEASPELAVPASSPAFAEAVESSPVGS